MRLPLIFLLTLKTVQALDLRECIHPLGMSNRKIKDDQITASSSFDLHSTGPQHARAHQETGSGAWCPQHQINSLSKEWIQISFERETVVTAIETQGRFDEGRGMEYPTAYRVEYWRPSMNGWAAYKNDDETETIPANNNTKNAVKRIFGKGIVAKRIRIVPMSNSTRTVCLRLELYGCVFEDFLTSYSVEQGDMQGAIGYHDFSYDGTPIGRKLVKGMGKLYDGQIGEKDITMNSHKWVGWKRKRNDFIPIEFNFSESQPISAIFVHTGHETSRNIRQFSAADVSHWDSDGQINSGIHYETIDNGDSESPRWIRIPCDQKTTKILKMNLYFDKASDWLFISEITFEYNNTFLAQAIDSVKIPETISFFSVSEQEDGSSIFVFVIVVLLALILLITVTLLYKKREDRVKASSPSPTGRKDILLTIDGETIKHVSPSTYQIARENLHNALLEKTPINVPSDYAEPDISLCSESTSNTPLLYGFEGPYEVQRSNPLSPLIKYSDYGEVYCTTLPEIAREKLVYVRKIGHGEFGEVDMCQLENRRVAVKRLHGETQNDEFSFLREIRVLGSLKHPNVVEVLGVSTLQKPILCIMEYMENGDLKSYMQSHQNVDVSTCIQICTQLAAGLSYLESCNFVHRDIAARNCLVDEEGNVKISDFGMARSLYSQEYYKVEGTFVLPIRWMSWEALLMGKFTTASDVWAFGVTMWEVFSRCSEKPFHHMIDDQIVDNLQSMSATGQMKAVLPKPTLCPTQIYTEQILPCWSHDPSRRPTFKQLHLVLQSMIHSTQRFSF